MNTYERIATRRAIKYFNPDAVIPDPVLEDILASASKLPNHAVAAWRVVRVQDAALRQRIRQVGFDQPQHTDASEILALCFDRKVFADTLAHSASPRMLAYFSDPEHVHDEAAQSTAMFAQAIMLSATAWGLDSCPMIGFQFDAVARLLELPPHVSLVMFVALGLRAREPHARGSRLPPSQTVIVDHFPHRDTA